MLPWSLEQAHTILKAGARTKAAIFNSAESAAWGRICIGRGVSCGNSEFISMMCEKEIQLTWGQNWECAGKVNDTQRCRDSCSSRASAKGNWRLWFFFLNQFGRTRILGVCRCQLSTEYAGGRYAWWNRRFFSSTKRRTQRSMNTDWEVSIEEFATHQIGFWIVGIIHSPATLLGTPVQLLGNTNC